MCAKKLLDHFSDLEDPRCAGKVGHRLMDILVIAVCATIAGAESFEDMALYGRSKQDWLKSFLALPNGIPAHDTFRRVFMLIDPAGFEAAFEAWAGSFGETLEREVVAIDGKTLRRSFDHGREQRPLHIVSAWACQRGLSLGQRQVDDKSNEITAIPDLLDTLRLKGTIVTLDAMGCQKVIASKILEQGADYLITLKANQGRMFAAVRDHCEQTCFRRGAEQRPAHDTFDESHGRLVRRRVFACPQASALEALRNWPGLHTVLAVETIRNVNSSGKTEAEIRYFLSSYQDAPEVLAKVIRMHWHIENSLHWILDVTFREDECRVRDRTAAQNLALLRKISINLVKQHRNSRASIKGRRKMAAWNDEYMTQVIAGKFHA